MIAISIDIPNWNKPRTNVSPPPKNAPIYGTNDIRPENIPNKIPNFIPTQNNDIAYKIAKIAQIEP